MCSRKSKLRLVLVNHSNNNDYPSNQVRSYPRQSQKGQTLIELIVVMSVSVIVVGALVFATIASLRNSQFSKYQVQATKLAQEGIEKVRSARDRNGNVTGSNGDITYYWSSIDPAKPNDRLIWDFQFYASCLSCYFKIDTDSGTLIYEGTDLLYSLAEMIPPFKRVVILSDDSATFDSQKTVTVIVKWTDFSGDHESRLTTILGKL